MWWPGGWNWFDRLMLWAVVLGAAAAVSMGWLVWLGCVFGLDVVCPTPRNGG